MVSSLLTGIKVIDLTGVVLGPYATQMLGDLGGDVIKVEPPGGDVFRAAEPSRNAGMGAQFLGCNRNKRSVVLDLKTDTGREALMRLLAGADVLIHNLRPAPAERLGLSYDAIKQLNPQLVYCPTVGFGSEGPYSDRPAYDDVIQAMSGLAHLNATPDGEPRYVPTILCDKIVGIMATQLVLAALVNRQTTGKGCFVGAPMFESLASFLMVEHLSARTFGPDAGRTGYERVLTPDRRPYRTQDGYMAVLPYTTDQWTRFLTFTGHTALAGQGWVRNAVERSKRIGELYALLGETMPGRCCDEWETVLTDLDIPFARVNALDDLFEDDHLKAVGLFQQVNHPTEGQMTSVRSPFETRDVPLTEDRFAPVLGFHTAEVLQEAGVSPDGIEKILVRDLDGLAETVGHGFRAGPVDETPDEIDLSGKVT